MPIKLYWDNDEKTIARYDFEGRWTWDEYMTVMAELAVMMRSVDHTVDAIGNMKPGIMPTSGSAMSLARAALRKLPANRGIIVVVTNPLVSAMLSMFKQFDKEIGGLLRGVSKVEDAYALIEREREREHA
jgi:hypothetical protein